MTEMPALGPENRSYISCPHCTIQIPADVPDCPYCRQPAPAGPSGKRKDIRGLLVPPERFPRFGKYYREHGKWVKVIGPALLAAGEPAAAPTPPANTTKPAAPTAPEPVLVLPTVTVSQGRIREIDNEIRKLDKLIAREESRIDGRCLRHGTAYSALAPS